MDVGKEKRKLILNNESKVGTLEVNHANKLQPFMETINR